jgi:hypothetical protein
VGYAALGRNEEWLDLPMATDIRGPCSHLHLYHNVMGERPCFVFRSQMRNGITLTGDSDLAYMGQGFDHGIMGEGISDSSESIYVGMKRESADRRSVLITEPSERFDVLNGPLLVERRCYDGVVT